MCDDDFITKISEMGWITLSLQHQPDIGRLVMIKNTHGKIFCATLFEERRKVWGIIDKDGKERRIFVGDLMFNCFDPVELVITQCAYDDVIEWRPLSK